MSFIVIQISQSIRLCTKSTENKKKEIKCHLSAVKVQLTQAKF